VPPEYIAAPDDLTGFICKSIRRSRLLQCAPAWRILNCYNDSQAVMRRGDGGGNP